MHPVERFLERPVAKTTAAKKVAKIRGHYGDVGGWIRTSYGFHIVQGWSEYAKRAASAGLIAQDEESGKWFVPVLDMSEQDYAAAMEVFKGKS